MYRTPRWSEGQKACKRLADTTHSCLPVCLNPLVADLPRPRHTCLFLTQLPAQEILNDTEDTKKHVLLFDSNKARAGSTSDAAGVDLPVPTHRPPKPQCSSSSFQATAMAGHA
jgi:hypothetical protein